MENKVKVGIQTWGLQSGGDLRLGTEDPTSYEDLLAILRQLKDAGYDGVEWTSAVFHSGYDLEKLGRDLKAIGLDNISVHCHYLGELDTEDNIEETVKNCALLGTDTLILAWTMPVVYGIPCEGNIFEETYVPEFSPKQMDAWVKGINQTSARVRKVTKEFGIRFMYHNHLGEFLKCSDGQFAVDKMEMDGLQIDAYWAVKGMKSFDAAIDYLEKNGNRIGLLHLKDGLRVSSGALFDDCSWGCGTYDIQRMVDVARKNHIPYVISDQDHPKFCGKTGMQDALDTISYVKKNIELSFL